jgi:DUF4097 and DUF4098 domain-containing protein YvlB
MEEIRTVTREFETGDKAVLHVESRSGSVLVEPHAAPHIHVEAVIRVWSEHGADADDAVAFVERGMSQDDQKRVIIRAPSLPQSEGWAFWGKRGARIDYNIRVPGQTAVRVLSRSGRVDVTHTQGRLHIESGSGRVSVADVAGDAEVTSRSGNVTVERHRGSVRIEARSGRLDVRNIEGTVSLQSRSGSVEARDIRGDLEIQAHTGSVTIEHPHGNVRARAQTGTVRFSGKVEGDVTLGAHTGSVLMAVDPATPFFLEAESEVGSVRSDLPPRRGGPAPDPASSHKVRLRTHTGSIRITRM